VVVVPEIPPLPPHVTAEQTVNMAKALVKGDPEALGVVRKSAAAKLGELILR
jgi:pyruvate dehydrogenase (quinone)